MAFQVGTDVVVASLQKKGRILEVGAKGRYRVVVGPMTLWCAEADLSSVSQARRKARHERDGGTSATGRPADKGVGTGSAPGEALVSERERRGLGSLDLHGLTVEEALRAVGERLDRAIRAGLDRVEIIHGISGGRLRAAVRGYLAGIPSVARFVPDPHNPGVTWVYF